MIGCRGSHNLLHPTRLQEAHTQLLVSAARSCVSVAKGTRSMIELAVSVQKHAVLYVCLLNLSYSAGCYAAYASSQEP